MATVAVLMLQMRLKSTSMSPRARDLPFLFDRLFSLLVGAIAVKVLLVFIQIDDVGCEDVLICERSARCEAEEVYIGSGEQRRCHSTKKLGKL